MKKKKQVQSSIAAVRAAEKLTADEITALALLGSGGTVADYAIQADTQGGENRSIYVESARSATTRFRLRAHTSTSMPVELRDEVMELTERNMKDMYEHSTKGWDKRDKMAELFDPTARFLVLTTTGEGDSAEKLAGFVNWRFDTETFMDDDPCVRDEDNGDVVEVAYCYELQVSTAFQRHGIGAVLMALLETIACATSMRKVVLTVFALNVHAMRFYRKIGYKVDPISPSQFLDVADADDDSDDAMGDYEIMSKLTWTP